MSVSHYLSSLLSISVILIDSIASENRNFPRLTRTQAPTVTFNKSRDISTSVFTYPKSMIITTSSNNSSAPDEILIGEYKNEPGRVRCQASKYQ